MEAIVETRSGRVRGLEIEGAQVFRGIPYAEPPLASLRFAPPQPVKVWTGTRDATNFGPSAPQNEMMLAALPGFQVSGQSEDCLYLNVYSPRADAGRRPVMVWIHGGAFLIGSGSQSLYDGIPLALRGNVVVVTINYRLGALGFLRLDDLGASPLNATGNAGFLDQIAALRWVQENIAAFGGDPSQVTIFGESAGGMSVGTLLGTPAAKGLFQRAIAQSGAAHNVHDRESAARIATLFLQEVGLSRDQVGKLREIPVAKLLEAQVQTLLKGQNAASLLGFQPVVDGDALPAPPLEAVRAGLAGEVPLLLGTTRDEWKLFAVMDPKLRELDYAGVVKRLEARLDAGKGRNSSQAQRMVDAYLREGKEWTAADLFTAIETDRLFRLPAVRLAEAQHAHCDQVYMYLLTWESPALDGKLGACHAIDLPFVFGTLETPGMEGFAGKGPAAQRLMETMMDAWLAFARRGDPSHPGLGSWDRYTPERRATMSLGERCELVDAPGEALCRVWDGIL